jgi:hypothetical protein
MALDLTTAMANLTEAQINIKKAREDVAAALNQLDISDPNSIQILDYCKSLFKDMYWMLLDSNDHYNGLLEKSSKSVPPYVKNPIYDSIEHAILSMNQIINGFENIKTVINERNIVITDGMGVKDKTVIE